MADNSQTNENMDNFKLNFLESLSDVSIVKKYQEILAPLFEPLEIALKSANAEIAQLKTQMAEKDATISALSKKVSDLEIHQDDLEQQGRKASVWVFGIPEDTPGNIDTKILSLCNKNLGLEPPLVLDDLEVTHRVGRPPAVPNPNDDSAESPPKPRPILVKFASRRVKGRVMDERSTLKDNPLKLDNGNTAKIYIQDDLTKRRANLAYRARQLKNAKKILDTWLSNCKILVKDNYNRITLVNDTHDLLKFENAQARAWYEMPGWYLDYSHIDIILWLPFIDIYLMISFICCFYFTATGNQLWSLMSVSHHRYCKFDQNISISFQDVSSHHVCHEVDGFFSFIHPFGLW